MNNQQAYDKVCAHLAKQKERAYDYDSISGNGCCYRTDDGKKCAFGCLIPPRAYKSKFEGKLIDRIFDMSPATAKALEGVSRTLLAALQGHHDRPQQSPVDLRKRLRQTARNYKLTTGAEKAITVWASEYGPK